MQRCFFPFVVDGVVIPEEFQQPFLLRGCGYSLVEEMLNSLVVGVNGEMMA